MSIMKSLIVILSLVSIVSVTARSNHRHHQQQRGRAYLQQQQQQSQSYQQSQSQSESHQQSQSYQQGQSYQQSQSHQQSQSSQQSQSYQAAAAQIIAEHNPNDYIIGKQLDKAIHHQDVLAAHEDLSHKEIAEHSQAVQKHLTVAIETANQHPIAQNLQQELASEKAAGHYEALSHHLNEAAHHQEVLSEQGKILSPKNAVQEMESLQHHLGLAQHHAIEHNIAAHELKGVPVMSPLQTDPQAMAEIRAELEKSSQHIAEMTKQTEDALKRLGRRFSKSRN